MNYLKRQLFIFCLCLPLSLWSQLQPFACDGSFYLSLGNGGTTGFFKVEVDRATGLAQFNSFSPNGSSGATVNAMGYRVNENLIYGVNPNSHTLYQVDATGIARQITNLNLNNSYRYVAGDFSVDGRYLVLLGDINSSSTQLAKVDFDNNFAVEFINLQAQSGQNLNMFAADIAFDPTSGELYAYNTRSNRLVKINPDNGIVEDNLFPGGQLAGTMGGLFFDAFGELHGYGGQANQGGGGQQTFFDINKETGRVSILTTGPSATQNDGCSCPYTIQMKQWTEPQVADRCDKVLYYIEIANSVGEGLERLNLENQLPDHLSIESIISNPYGGLSSGDPSKLILENISVPVGRDTIILEVSIGPEAADTLKNQAVLFGLPTSLGDSVLSDNPFTPATLDSTVLLLRPSLEIDPPNIPRTLCEGQFLTLDAFMEGDLTFQWNTADTTSQIVVDQPGTYWVQINGCQRRVDTFIVSQQALPEIIANGPDEACVGDTVQLLAQGGVNYVWIKENIQLGAGEIIVFPLVSSGNYIVSGTDNLGCRANDTLAILAKPLPRAFAGTDKQICLNETITLGENGNPSFAYTWTPTDRLDTPLQAQAVFEPSTAGSFSFSLHVYDPQTQCSNEDQVEINVVDFGLAYFPLDVSCFGEASGQIEIEVIGTPQFSFSLLDSLGNVANSGSFDSSRFSIKALKANKYELSVLDGNSCTQSIELEIGQPMRALAISLENKLDVDCFGNLTGLLDVGASGGTAPYEFMLNDLQLSNTDGLFPNLGASVYRITVVDNNRCESIFKDTIKSPTGLFGELASQQAVSCFGEENGSLRVNAVGGSPPYRLSLDKQVYVDNLTFSGLPAGLDTLFLLDANNCEVAIPFLITQPDVLIASLDSVSHINCYGEASGTIHLDIQGGTAPFGYTFNATMPQTFPLASGANSISDLGAGQYMLYIEDINGCTTSISAELQQPPALEIIVVDLQHIDCAGNENGSVQLNARGGISPYTLKLNNQADNNNTWSSLDAGDYQIRLTDGNQCILEEILNIAEPDPLQLSIESLEDAFCSLPNGQLSLLASGGSPPYLYQWPNDTESDQASSDQLAPGSYLMEILDENMCVADINFTIGDTPPPIAQFSYLPGPDAIILETSPTISFMNESRGSINRFLWDFGTTQISTEESPTYTFPGPGVYTVSLTAYDPFGSCPNTFSLEIEIQAEGSIWMPNMFSPNGDGINDVFKVLAEGLSSMEIIIFDRWGRQVYTQRQPENNWDGNMSNGQPAKEGVYYFVMEAILNTGEKVQQRGHLTLLR